MHIFFIPSDVEGDLDLHAYFLDPSSNDINTAASVLKLYLRSLPEPLLTNLLQDDFHKGSNNSLMHTFFF